MTGSSLPAAGGTAGKEADRRGYRRFAPYPVTKAAPGLSAISSSFTSKPPLPLETANMGLFRLSLETVTGEGPPNVDISDRDALYDVIDRA